MFLHGLFVIRRRVALDNPYRARRAFREAVAHAVAVVVLDEPRLAIYNGDCALVAGVCAQTASVALRLVDLDNLSFHVSCLLFLVDGAYYTKTDL